MINSSVVEAQIGEKAYGDRERKIPKRELEQVAAYQAITVA